MVYGIKRNDLTEYSEYIPEKANNEYLKNKKNKQGNFKIGNNLKLAVFIEGFINEYPRAMFGGETNNEIYANELLKMCKL